MTMKLEDIFEDSPVITAVKDEAGLLHALETDSRVVFILFGNICSIPQIVERVKARGKLAFVHVDLITGFSAKEIVVEFIKENTSADGIISTRPALVKRAMELGLLGGLRAFLIDSIALENTRRQLAAFQPDFMEIMPGVIPKVFRQIRGDTSVLLVAGGLMSDKPDIMAAFQAGADAVSTTKEELWAV
ncbi:MAG: glycerol-3-phosphate responsive antiterminator [Lachnospiraceae bacterium]|nr:glycerol-3-phosphate responsive antiterminator [Lachnospiraceae bacterium]